MCKDDECSVCLQPYSRVERIPRMLHCRHTFCEPCLETMSQVRSRLLTVGCPLCRRVTCVSRGLSLKKALWVNSKLWDQIPEEVDERTGESQEDGLKQQAGNMEVATQVKDVSSRLTRTKLKFPGFFKRFSLLKQTEERIVPGSNVEMRSWRRLPTELTA